jgi:hypothetical protein
VRLGFLSVAIVLLAWANCPAATGSSIAYSTTTWNGIPVHFVSVNLNSPDLKVTVSLAEDGPGSSESFHSMLRRTRPAAAVTGTFFCTRSLLPTGDIVIEGRQVYSGSLGKGVCITSDNNVEFVPYREGRRSGWQGYQTVLCAGPTLVQDGKVFLSPKTEGFTDPGLFGQKRRTAIGVTPGNKLLLVSVDRPIYLRSLAKIMLHLGAVDAVDLDGGSSSALYCNGRFVSRPGRRLTNLLVVYDSLTDYHQRRYALAPQFRNPGASITMAAGSPSVGTVDDILAEEAPGMVLGYRGWISRHRPDELSNRGYNPARQAPGHSGAIPIAEISAPEPTVDTEDRPNPFPLDLQIDLAPAVPRSTSPTPHSAQKDDPGTPNT